MTQTLNILYDNKSLYISLSSGLHIHLSTCLGAITGSTKVLLLTLCSRNTLGGSARRSTYSAMGKYRGPPHAK